MTLSPTSPQEQWLQERERSAAEAIHDDCDPSELFEQRLASICGSIEAVELKCEASDERRRDAEEQLLVVTQRLRKTDAVLQSALPKLSFCQAENLDLKAQVHHLQLELASCQDTCDDLAASGEIERARLSSTLASFQLERDSAVLEREGALTDLAGAYSDMQAMQAALLDSALYVRLLRSKLCESKLDNNEPGSEDQSDGRERGGMLFSFEKTKQAIKTAVHEAAKLDPAERAKRINSLRLRWHPDKNPDFALDFANEVTKIINETVSELQI